MGFFISNCPQACLHGQEKWKKPGTTAGSEGFYSLGTRAPSLDHGIIQPKSANHHFVKPSSAQGVKGFILWVLGYSSLDPRIPQVSRHHALPLSMLVPK